VTKDSGAEILRLWVAMSDYAEDLRIGKTILQTTIDSYRKLRNSLRYLLGALDGFTEAERVSYADMPPLERFVLHRLWMLDAQVRDAYGRHRYDEVWRPVTEFCAQELSALYFDVRKDALYCDAPSSLRRRAARTVMDLCFERLTVWLSPIAVFTTEEAWTTRFPDAGANALRVFPQTPDAWRNEAEAERWAKVQAVLAVVTGALEVERREKRIGSALEAAPKVTVGDAALLAAFDGVDPAEVFRTSQAELVAGDDADGFRLAEIDGVSVRPFRAEGAKCARCWRVLPEVTEDLCVRCTAAVAEIDAA
jgi:isoleucyl-tRNA synthetase